MNSTAQDPTPPSEALPNATAKEPSVKSTTAARVALASGPAAASDNARKQKKKNRLRNNTQGDDLPQPDQGTPLTLPLVTPPWPPATPPLTQEDAEEGGNTTLKNLHNPSEAPLPNPPSEPGETPPRFVMPELFREALLPPPHPPPHPAKSQATTSPE
ncbi:hypothetical protein EDB83DRAFT_2536602 [Lactarius deliciosus]|nr:hypothetical protein EDB83DRAFT_2536602 [Lactarius deliciosus]